MATKNKRSVIVRTYSAGVHFGTLVEKNGEEVTLADARRIWNWQGRNTLNEIALHGVGKKSRVSEPVPRIELLQAIEIIDCTSEAVENLEAAKWDA
jgi:hypothetical protein